MVTALGLVFAVWLLILGVGLLMFGVLGLVYEVLRRRLRALTTDLHDRAGDGLVAGRRATMRDAPECRLDSRRYRPMMLRRRCALGQRR
jgi:hypothetical protein